MPIYQRKDKMTKSSKGSKFEREICKLLSLWWTDNKRDDIFWRTSGSGARAKTRSKTNRDTFGQYGDIQATDPIGQPLIDLCSIELKKGYSKHTFADLLDRNDSHAVQVYEGFILQAMQDSKNAKAKYWLLIAGRDRRENLICMPYSFFKAINRVVDNRLRKRPTCKMEISIRPFETKITKWKDAKNKRHTKTEKMMIDVININIIILPLNIFLDRIRKQDILRL